MNVFGEIMMAKRLSRLEDHKMTANNLGYCPQYYCKLERGKIFPSIHVLRSCKNKYGLTQEEIELILKDKPV